MLPPTLPLPPPAHEDLTPEDRALLGPRYEIIDERGRKGGMGIVYRARHRALGLPVAIKVTLPGVSKDRFLREAQLLASIKSPHVVAVHDYDVLPDGRPMLVMEWVEGTDLHRTLRGRGGAVLEDEALSWMRQTTVGMLAAETQGIVHRDLKPSNILLNARGQVQVADFGLARAVTQGAGLSRTGGLMGTPFYMAPEQAEDPRAVDVRADIYSFGATFYHMLTGAPPFEGETEFAVLYKAKTEPLIPPRTRRPELSQRTCEVLERCLAKSPHDRFASFAEVGKHLQPTPIGSSPWDATDDAELAGYWGTYQGRRPLYLSCALPRNEPDDYRFPRGQVIRILCGNIVEQHVDALVSSDNFHLTMHVGVSQAIREAGGPEILREARRFAPVLPGRAVVTSAGNLPARFVFHGVVVGGSFQNYEWIAPSRDVLKELMASCFHHADSLYVRSMAFPLLGAGAAGFSREVCLDTMFQYLARTFLRGLTHVREARIVIYE